MVRVPCQDYSDLHVMANSITDFPEVGVQLSEWWVTLHLCTGMYDSVDRCGEIVTLATSLQTLAESLGFS